MDCSKVFIAYLLIFICCKCNGQSQFSLNEDSTLQSLHVKTEVYYTFLSPRDSMVFCVNSYNNLGNLHTSKRFTQKGKIEETDSLLYNDKNMLARELIFDNNGSIKFTSIYKYDTLENCTSVKEYDKYGKLSCSTNSSYNNRHQIIYTQQETANITYFKTANYYYDANDNLEKLIYKYNDTDSTIYSYTNNRLEKIIRYNKLKNQTIFYQYGKQLLDEIVVTTVINKNKKSGFEKMYFEYNNNGLVAQRLSYVISGLKEKIKCYYTFY